MDMFGMEQPQSQSSVAQTAAAADTNPLGIGTEEATPEEQAALDSVMDGIMGALHGEASTGIIQSLKSAPDIITGVAMIATPMIQQADMELEGQGHQVPDEIWFGENGAIQQTVELVWEMAEASGLPGTEDGSQLEAAYMQTMSMIGEYLYENDPDSVLEAQEAMMGAELGNDVMMSLEEEAMATQAMTQEGVV